MPVLPFRPPEEPELKPSTGNLDSNNPIDRKKRKSLGALPVTGLPSSWNAIRGAKGFNLNRMAISRKARSHGLSWMLTTLPPRLAARAFHSSSSTIPFKMIHFYLG